MASLDDIIEALQTRNSIIKKRNAAQKAYGLMKAFETESAPPGSAAYEIGKYLTEKAMADQIDLNTAFSSMGGITGSYQAGSSFDQIALENLLTNAPNAFAGQEGLSYSLPAEALNKIAKQSLLEKALLDIDPVAQSIANPRPKLSELDLLGALKSVFTSEE
jgi:hypothetical protein